MSESNDKGGLLARIKQAILFSSPESPEKESEKTETESVQPEKLDFLFAQNFTGSGGKFAYCIDSSELVQELQLLYQDGKWTSIFCTDPRLAGVLREAGLPSKDLLGLAECQATLTPCEFLMADTGQVLMSSRIDKSRQLKACPDVQLVVAFTHQICSNESHAMNRLDEKYGDHKPASLSRLSPTPVQSDPNSVLDAGGHGPKELYVFLLENESVV